MIIRSGGNHSAIVIYASVRSSLTLGVNGALKTKDARSVSGIRIVGGAYPKALCSIVKICFARN